MGWRELEHYDGMLDVYDPEFPRRLRRLWAALSWPVRLGAAWARRCRKGA